MARKVDYSDLKKYQKKLERMAQSKSGITTRKVMRDAVEPALTTEKQLVPQPGSKHPYSKGGLKKTLRTKIVRDSPYEIKALVGARKRKIAGKWNAGNMAHLQEKGPITGKRFWRHTPFAAPAEALTKGVIERRLDVGVNRIIKDDFRSEQ